jgi:hypothetical protein
VCAGNIEDAEPVFNNPEWAALIDVKTAGGVASALSHARLGAFGLEPHHVVGDAAVHSTANLVGAVSRHGINSACQPPSVNGLVACFGIAERLLYGNCQRLFKCGEAT